MVVVPPTSGCIPLGLITRAWILLCPEALSTITGEVLNLIPFQILYVDLDIRTREFRSLFCAARYMSCPALSDVGSVHALRDNIAMRVHGFDYAGPALIL